MGEDSNCHFFFLLNLFFYRIIPICLGGESPLEIAAASFDRHLTAVITCKLSATEVKHLASFVSTVFARLCQLYFLFMAAVFLSNVFHTAPIILKWSVKVDRRGSTIATQFCKSEKIAIKIGNFGHKSKKTCFPILQLGLGKLRKLKTKQARMIGRCIIAISTI